MSHLWFCPQLLARLIRILHHQHHQSLSTDIHRSTRVRAPPSHLTNYHCYFALATLHEPHTYRETSTNPLWQQAMANELNALHKTHTWDMTTLPPSKSAIGCKWVYKIKTWVDGSVERYKACLVAKGFTQEYGIHYEETFAPIARLTSVLSLLIVAVSTCSHLLATLILIIKFVAFAVLSMVLSKLLRPGLLSSVLWLLSKGFTPSSYDSALFIRHTSTGITLILLYVDDMIITGDDTAGIRDLQKFLSQQFEMKDLGTLSYFLGLEVTSSSDGYYLSQAKYASDLLSKAGLTDSKTVSTPLELNVKLNTTDGEPLSDATLYRQLVGSLIYLTVTRPDLAYAVHLVSQFMSAPRSTHYAAVLRILRYIKETLFHGLPLSCAPMLMQTGLEISLVVALPQVTASYWVPLLSLGVERNSLLLLVPILKLSTVLSPMPPQNSSSFVGPWLTWVLPRPPIALHLLSISSEDQLADVFTKSHPPGRLRDLMSKLKMASLSPPCV
uniref:Reverse transcriptase Ty1/copia-type domain-containing protein n=1 Tax=Fagus sylvatica TaxID=28930 RepID=A0A2N9FMK4_FAGSY